jgi:hypothetical protein
MIRRLYNSLFRPKYIALYLKDKLWLSFLYVIILFSIAVSPAIVKYSVTQNNISFSNLNNAVDMIPQDSNAKVVDYVFSSDVAFQIKVDTVTYNFGTKDLYVPNKGVTFVYSGESIIVYQDGIKLVTDSFKNIGVKDLNFSTVKTDSKEYANYYVMMNTIYNKYFRVSNFNYGLYIVRDGLVETILIILVLYFAVSMIAPFLKSGHKLNIVLYSLTWYFVLMFVSNATVLTYLYFVGLVIAFIFIRKALSSIKIIQIPKGSK